MCTVVLFSSKYSFEMYGSECKCVCVVYGWMVGYMNQYQAQRTLYIGRWSKKLFMLSIYTHIFLMAPYRLKELTHHSATLKKKLRNIESNILYSTRTHRLRIHSYIEHRIHMDFHLNVLYIICVSILLKPEWLCMPKQNILVFT